MTASTLIETPRITVSTSGHTPPPQHAEYYPTKWPSVPFHEGEIALQQLKGVHEKVMSYAPNVIRPYLPQQHRDFYEAQPFLVAAARDQQGNLWATLLQNRRGNRSFATSPTPTMLQLEADLPATDALYDQLRASTDLGLLGIELATRRRNRVNGRLVQSSNNKLTFQVDQSFGNCPQYIVPRQWWSTAETETESTIAVPPPASTRPRQLDQTQMEQIQAASTVFVATGYRGVGDDVRFGNDASHRGGPAGFVQVLNETTLQWPEFAGNNHYNSLGNLQLDDRMGLTFPSWEHGGLLQLSGTGSVNMNADEADKVFPGATALVTFTIQQVNVVPDGSLPLRWSAPAEKRKARVTKKVVESADVTSFYLTAVDGASLWKFQAGQHLPITLITSEHGELERTYSLSDHWQDSCYRISVKREPYGIASRWLHDHVEVGDEILMQQPAGDFVLQQPLNQTSTKTTVLLSMGVGITPLVSMLKELVASKRQVTWIHGARDGAHDALRSEIDAVVTTHEGQRLVKVHHVYSRPAAADAGSYTSTGRVDPQLVQKLAGDLDTAEFYMCGTEEFTSSLEQGLEMMGVDPQDLHVESF